MPGWTGELSVWQEAQRQMRFQSNIEGMEARRRSLEIYLSGCETGNCFNVKVKKWRLPQESSVCMFSLIFGLFTS